MTGSGPTDAPLLAGRYAIRDPIGRGRSTVHRATDTRLRREVAIKEVRLSESQEAVDQVRLRATREARAAARLNNPGVVTVYDVVEEGGSIWLVMELVEAPSLAQIVGDEGPLTHPRAARIGQGVVTALQAAHAVGIVHRDVKPANVLVMIGDRTKLADFGVATIRDESRVTATGTIVGSPSYMAPEQAMAADVGPFTDLWALGATLYFAVEGVPPFVGDSPLATASAVVHGEPRPPQNRGPLTSLIMRLLDKDARRRPSARQVKVTLAAIAGRGPERRDDTLIAPSPLARGSAVAGPGTPAAAPSPRSRRDPRRIVIPGARRKGKAGSPTPPRPQPAAPAPAPAAPGGPAAPAAPAPAPAAPGGPAAPAAPAPAPAARADEVPGDITYAAPLAGGPTTTPAADPVAEPAAPPEAPAPVVEPSEARSTPVPPDAASAAEAAAPPEPRAADPTASAGTAVDDAAGEVPPDPSPPVGHDAEAPGRAPSPSDEGDTPPGDADEPDGSTTAADSSPDDAPPAEPAPAALSSAAPDESTPDPTRPDTAVASAAAGAPDQDEPAADADPAITRDPAADDHAPADAATAAAGASSHDEPRTAVDADDAPADATRRHTAVAGEAAAGAPDQDEPAADADDEAADATRRHTAVAGEAAAGAPDQDEPAADADDEAAGAATAAAGAASGDGPRTTVDPAIAGDPAADAPDDAAATDATRRSATLAATAAAGAPDDGESRRTKVDPAIAGEAATRRSTAVAGDAAVGAPGDAAVDGRDRSGAGAGEKLAALGADARKRWATLGPQRQRVVVAAAVLVLLALTIWAFAGGGGGGGGDGDGAETGERAETTASTTATSAETTAEAPGGGEEATTTTVADEQGDDESDEQGDQQGGQQADVPDGWTEYQDPTAGYTIAHPAGWRVEPADGPRMDIRDPETGSYLRIDWTDEPRPDPVADWQAQSQSFASRHEAYQEIRIEPYEYRDYNAAIWEFTYRDGGADLHVANIGFVAGPRGYALYFQTREDRWAGSQDTFATFRETFQPPS